MDANAQYELSLIKNELQKIIDELYSVASGINKDFAGIGNDKCANRIITVAKQYEDVKKKLNNMNLSVVTEEFAEKKRKSAQVTPTPVASPTKNTAQSKVTTEKEIVSKTTENSSGEKSKNKKSISDAIDDVVDNVVDAVGDIADAIGGIFKKWK